MSNVAVVVLDTLRYDKFDEYFDWIPGLRFTSAYSTSHWTIPAHASLYTGKYPSEVDVHAKSLNINYDDTLPKMLKRNGYNTQLMSTNPQIYMWDGWKDGYENHIPPTKIDPEDENLADWTYFYANYESKGVRKYIDAVRYCVESDCSTIPSIWEGLKATDSPAINSVLSVFGADEYISKRNIGSVINRIDQTEFGDQEFLFLNLLDAHTPYDPPSNYTELDTPIDALTSEGFSEPIENPSTIKKAYDDAARYLSDEYKTLFEKLEEDFDYIITLSDHGEMLGEHDKWNHGYGLYPELTHIPLVISGTGISDGHDNSVVNLLDVHKTLADLTGIKVDSRGQNLLNDPCSNDILIEYHGFLPWHKNQFDRADIPIDVFNTHDIALDGFISKKNEYIYETHEHGIQIPEEITEQEAYDQLEDIVSQLDRNSEQKKTTQEEIPQSVKEQLEDLGYA